MVSRDDSKIIHLASETEEADDLSLNYNVYLLAKSMSKITGSYINHEL